MDRGRKESDRERTELGFTHFYFENLYSIVSYNISYLISWQDKTMQKKRYSWKYTASSQKRHLPGLKVIILQDQLHFFFFALQPSKMKLLNIMIILFKLGGMNLEISKSSYNGCYAPAFSTSQTHMTEHLTLPEVWHFSVSRHAQTWKSWTHAHTYMCTHVNPHTLTSSRCVSIELHHWDVVGDLSMDFAA